MEGALKIKADGFIETFEKLKKQYRWSVGDLTLRFIALLYILGNKIFYENELNDMVEFIKKNSRLFSNYRGHQMFSTAAMLITRFDHPQQAFQKLLEYEEKLKAGEFKTGPYLSIASYALMLTCSGESVNTRVNKSMDLYKEMRKKHFWLTGRDDYPIAVLLSASDERVDTLLAEIENNYNMLREEGFMRSNGLQFLSHLLTFIPGSAQIKAHHTRDIYNRLKQERLHVSSAYYGVLGYLSILGSYGERAAEEVIEVVRYLKSQKSFRWVQKDMNVLSATALVANKYMDSLNQHDELLKAGIGISIETMIAAQTAALIAAASAAAASSAGASAGN